MNKPLIKVKDINEIKKIIGNNLNNYLNIEINWKEIYKKEILIKKIYTFLWCPNYFWLNWDAFWDTINDNTFWVKKPLVLIFKNYNSIFDWKLEEKEKLFNILNDLNKKKDYYIFILKEDK